MLASCENLDAETRPIMARMKKSRSNEKTALDSDSDSAIVSDIDSDIEIENSDDHTWFVSFVADVILYTTCLTQLGTALECVRV